MAGTATRTFASAEGSDDDRDYRAFQITPLESVPVSGTQTLTRIFFEVNPNGQWAWLDLSGGMNIAASFVKTFSKQNAASQ